MISLMESICESIIKMPLIEKIMFAVWEIAAIWIGVDAVKKMGKPYVEYYEKHKKNHEKNNGDE